MPHRLDEIESDLKRLTGWRYWLPVVLTSLIASLAVGGVVAWLVGESNDATTRAAVAGARAALADGQRQGCGPQNVRQALNRKIVGDGIPELRKIYAAANPVLWCERTYTRTNNGQKRYLLQGRARECFINLAFSGYFVHRKPFTDQERLRRACSKRG